MNLLRLGIDGCLEYLRGVGGLVQGYMDERLMREYIKAVKDERRRRSTERIGTLLKGFGKAIPKGIRHPDSLITNLHLYQVGRKGTTKLR